MILSLPDGGAQDNLLRAAVGPVESFSGYGRGYKHPVLDPPHPRGTLAARRTRGGVTSNALLDIRLHTYPPDAPTIGSGQKHGDPQELPVVRSRLGSVPWPVRPAMQSQGGTGDPAAPTPDY